MIGNFLEGVLLRVKFKIAAVMFLFASLLGSARAAGPIKIIKVSIDCTTDDSGGTGVCSALKERVRGSKGFELVSHKEAVDDPKGFSLRLVSVSIHTTGGTPLGSAVAILFALPKNRGDIYINQTIEIIQNDEADSTARDIFADLDEDSEFLQK